MVLSAQVEKSWLKSVLVIQRENGCSSGGAQGVLEEDSTCKLSASLLCTSSAEFGVSVDIIN